MKLSNKKLLIFDVDNTLYDELQFLTRKMNIFLINEGIDEQTLSLVLSELETCFKKNNVEFIIQHLNFSFNLNLSVEAYIRLLRDIDSAVEISFFPGVREKIMKMIESGLRIRLLTNGNKIQQKQKINSLSRILNLSEIVVYAEEYAPKPDPAGINLIVEQERFNKLQVLFVGDSKIDYDCAVNAQVDFMSAKDFFGETIP